MKKSLLHASLDECLDHFDTRYNIREATKVPQKPRHFFNFSFFVVMLFGRVVAKFGVDFAWIFGTKINETAIQN